MYPFLCPPVAVPSTAAGCLTEPWRTPICYVIEVKDGDQFDTKKASSEYITLHNFTNDISQALAISFQIYLFSFNAETKEQIYNGLKRSFSLSEILKEINQQFQYRWRRAKAVGYLEDFECQRWRKTRQY